MSEQKVILYSTGCPQCKVLKAKLDAKSIPYETVSDVPYMLSIGITAAPQLDVNGERMDFKTAVAWVNQQ